MGHVPAAVPVERVRPARGGSPGHGPPRRTRRKKPLRPRGSTSSTDGHGRCPLPRCIARSSELPRRRDSPLTDAPVGSDARRFLRALLAQELRLRSSEELTTRNRRTVRSSGEGGIRTRGTLPYTRFPVVHLRPLGHLSRYYVDTPRFVGPAPLPRNGRSEPTWFNGIKQPSVAERAGFEPAVPLRVHLISNQAPSASRSPLRGRTWQSGGGRSSMSCHRPPRRCAFVLGPCRAAGPRRQCCVTRARPGSCGGAGAQAP